MRKTHSSKRPPAAGPEARPSAERPAALRPAAGRLPRVPREHRGNAATAAEAHPDLLALAIAGANDGLWEWDAVSGRVYRSARVQQILGLAPTDLESTAEAWYALMHPDDVAHYRQVALTQFHSASDHFECEYRIRCADGVYRWVHDRAIVLRDRSGRVYRMAGSVSDITERKRMEEALRESEQRFRTFAEISSDWFWETGPDHRFIDTATRLPEHGLGQGHRLGKRRWDLAADLESEPEKWRAHKATLERHEPFRDFIYKVGLADGTVQFVAVGGQPVFDAAGRFMGYRGVGRDVTDTVIRGQALRQAMVEAESANAAKSQFLANMSHELRTPLNAILGFSEVIASEMLGAVGNARYREYAEDILNSGQHLLELISDILDMSKIEAGKLELHDDKVRLAAVAAACLPLVRQRAVVAGIEIALEVPSDLPPLRADEMRVKQILLNLLTNGVKFTPHGGRVCVSAGLEADRALTLRVVDTGIGMTEKDVALALEPFGQIDNATAKRLEGTGLGLPLTKLLVELHGGTIEIASALGRGTAVTVRFPSSRVL